ncbi:helix-turn-helix transcriptional regulator [Vibrio mediterranei]|jgi:predicted DNA-binding transcriptional regulator AlpA|uniref:helix-turn-helix transcriptional regulator n=1 Tax=Vibrio mediterranei TaxID=689 RepID=UPI0039908508
MQNTEVQSKLYTLEEVRIMLGVSKRTINTWIRRKVLPKPFRATPKGEPRWDKKIFDE